MDVHEERPDATYIINGYELGEWVKINNTAYSNTVIVGADILIHEGLPKSLSDMSDDDWQTLIDTKPELALIGTGKQTQQINAKLLVKLQQHNIGVECMDTGAACRTYSALLTEGRHIIALLFN